LRLFAAIIPLVQDLKLTIKNSTIQKLPPLLLDWFSTNARDLPWRRTRDPYAIWVSEVMLQQTQVKTVMPYWERWMRELPTIESVAWASPAKIHKLWEGLGYYTRARNLQKAARQIIVDRRAEFHDAQTNDGVSQSSSLRKFARVSRSLTLRFPEKYEDILALPGIGRYTAGAICSIAFNQPVPILDGNVIRVLTRVFGIAENPREKETNARLWKLAEQLVSHAKNAKSAKIFLALRPSRSLREENSRTRKMNFTAREDARPTSDWNCSHLNQSLMELGALICTPRNPQCGLCPAKKLCIALKENRIEELPNLGKRQKATARKFIAFVVERDGKFLVRQRPENVVNAHLWEFPNAEMVNGKSNPKLAAKNIFGIEPARLEHFHTLKHSITRYRITLEAYYVSVGGRSSTKPPSKSGSRGARASGILSGTRITRPSEGGIWKTPAQMRQLAFTAAYRKILDILIRNRKQNISLLGQ
jgi:A/G-specific adenine glycosylase